MSVTTTCGTLAGKLLVLLGEALQAAGRRGAATACFQRATQQDGQLATAWGSLGSAQGDRGHYAAAIQNLQRCLELDPGDIRATFNLGRALYNLGEVDAALDHFEKLQHQDLGDGGCQLLGSLATIIPGSSRASNQTILEVRRAWAVHCATPPTKLPRRKTPDPALGRRLRVGYVSSFFQSENWMKPVWGLINQHDRERFEIHLFSDAPRAAITSGYCDRPSDRFHDITNLSNEAAAGLIADQCLDILVDLNCYSTLPRLPLLAHRPALVIVGWFNAFATTGLAAFDYLIGDAAVIPEDEEAFYSEKILRVPGSYLTFEVTYPTPEVVPPPCCATSRFTFGSLASPYKLTPGVIEAWAEILRRCPGAGLVLKNGNLGLARNRRFVAERFASLGIDPARLDLEGPAEHYDFLWKYNEIDLALDTFPYSGGTTTTEALWQGVPVLTCKGDRWAARTSLSILLAGGLDAFVAEDLDDYINRAVYWATAAEAPQKLAALRETMRDRLRGSPVCDTRTFAANMEALYIQSALR